MVKSLIHSYLSDVLITDNYLRRNSAVERIHLVHCQIPVMSQKQV